tara:strand:- start:251 stop:517 length:267 start_codon:yes stop_codon:yes gene_type:complete
MAIKTEETIPTNRRELHEYIAAGHLVLPQGIKTIRKALGLNQEAFARLFKLTRRQVSELENEKSDVRISTLNRIGRVLGYRVGFILAD